MNFNKSFPFFFSTQNKFLEEFEYKNLELFSLVTAVVAPHKETTINCNMASKAVVLSLSSGFVPLG